MKKIINIGAIIGLRSAIMNNEVKNKTRELSKIVAIVLIVMVLVMILSGCGRTYPRPSLDIDPELELEIRRTMMQDFEQSPNITEPVSIDDFWVEFYYGTYNGVSVVFMRTTKFAGGDAMTTVIVSGIEFIFPTTIVFSAWRKGNFYSVQQAYDNGWLTRPQLRTIRDIHQEWRQEMATRS